MPPTLTVSVTTRARIRRLKSGPREKDDEVIRRLLALLPDGDEEGRYTDAFLIGLLNSRFDIRRGRLVSLAEVKGRLGL
jgi:hypothetical protein